MTMSKLPFERADILLPKKDFDKWATVACDQYTSQRDYWEKAYETVADAPSALKITLPEVYLNDADVSDRIKNINSTMEEYINGGIFNEYKDAMIFVERRLKDGRTRKGIVGKIDLEAYDYSVGSTSLVRATEGTVLSRIPPRVEIRKDAPIELPHIMVLIDDVENEVVPNEPDGQILYDTPLMLGGGSIRGSLMSEKAINKAITALEKQMESRELLFAMGDGNHSLATAKACYERDKSNPLARYALVEIVNIHDPALDFEPIYRVVFGVDTEKMLNEAKKYFDGNTENKVVTVVNGVDDEFCVNGLTAGVLQEFIDKYIEANGGEVDYIHGENDLRELCTREDAIGFLFDGIKKSELFPYVEKHGALPRKTFSMGEAYDKRYYMECRRIK